MLTLPDEVAVRVVDADGSPRADVLVHLQVLHGGHYYFGDLVGLTGPDGWVRKRGRAIAASFEEDRKFFIMDYRVPLQECDSELRVGVTGGREFEAARESARSSGVVMPEALALWAAAVNSQLGSATAVLRQEGRNAAAELRL